MYYIGHGNTIQYHNIPGTVILCVEREVSYMLCKLKV